VEIDGRPFSGFLGRSSPALLPSHARIYWMPGSEKLVRLDARGEFDDSPRAAVSQFVGDHRIIGAFTMKIITLTTAV
jgi:hypothetical protein